MCITFVTQNFHQKYFTMHKNYDKHIQMQIFVHNNIYKSYLRAGMANIIFFGKLRNWVKLAGRKNKWERSPLETFWLNFWKIRHNWKNVNLKKRLLMILHFKSGIHIKKTKWFFPSIWIMPRTELKKFRIFTWHCRALLSYIIKRPASRK